MLDSDSQAAMCDETGSAPSPGGAAVPLFGTADAASAACATALRRPWLFRGGRPLRLLLDRVIAASSLVPNDPILDMRAFAWTAPLRDHWREIQAEGVAAARAGRPVPLYSYGHPIDENLNLCPRTRAAIEAIPGLNTACFAVLAPGEHIAAHRGVSKGLLTCHLGLSVPRGGDVRMRIGDRMVRWAEGETLVFDDTYDHEIWNDAAQPRIVLSIKFARPMGRSGRAVADYVLGLVKRSGIDRDARADALADTGRWSAAVRELEAA